MEHSLPESFRQNIHRQQLFPRHARLIVAASGGLDSVVLCHLLKQQGYSFLMAHCHFGLRGRESDRDAAFVEELARLLEVPFHCKHFDTKTFATTARLSIQEAARTLRYDWFAALREEVLLPDNHAQNSQPCFVLTAHHQDDDIETLLMNFFKGTGMQGLKGIPVRNGHLVRPLLFARRAQLEIYAQQEGLQWVEDSSNKEIKYTRNFFRHEVLPLISRRVPQVMDNLAANLTRFSEAAELYQQAVDLHLGQLGEQKGAELHIPVLKLAKTRPLATITFELLKPYGFTPQQTAQVLQLLESESGRYVQSSTHQVVRHRRWLIVAPIQAPANSMVLVEQGHEVVSFQQGQLLLQETHVPRDLQTQQDTALFDLDKLQFPLILRPWKAGDYCYPLGLGKKKKVSRLLIDLKLSKTAKETVYVLESGSRIIWVVGMRMDDRFKITPATKKVLRCTFSPRG